MSFRATKECGCEPSSPGADFFSPRKCFRPAASAPIAGESDCSISERVPLYWIVDLDARAVESSAPRLLGADHPS